MKESNFGPLLAKLRCVQCRSERIDRLLDEPAFYCLDCHARYAIEDGQFANFEDASETTVSSPAVPPVVESESSYQRWANLMGVTRDKEVLEIGCGPGRLLRRLEANVRVGLETTKSQFQRREGFIAVVGQPANLPFRDASFDLVYFRHQLHQVRDRAAAWREAVRVTRPGGKIVVMEPNRFHPQRKLLASDRPWARRLRWCLRLTGPVGALHSVEEIRAQGSEAGLRAVKVVYTDVHADRTTFRQSMQKLYARILKSIVPLRYLMPNYFIAFEKNI
jgi:ubiquinone/menaquinone biosynthesis C-methylase UbiE